MTRGYTVCVAFLALASWAFTEAEAILANKICWEPCSGSEQLQHVEIEGCRRRIGLYGRTPRFWCEGMRGPPCTVVRGDTVTLNIDFTSDKTFHNATHKAVWVTSFGIELPWAGMDHDVCKYLNTPCGQRQDKYRFSYPIDILKMYPAGKYNLKWTLEAKDDHGETLSLGCMRMTIRIL